MRKLLFYTTEKGKARNEVLDRHPFPRRVALLDDGSKAIYHFCKEEHKEEPVTVDDDLILVGRGVIYEVERREQ